MNIIAVCALIAAAATVWLGLLCIFIGVRKFKRKSLAGPLCHEFLLHQPSLGLAVSFGLMFISGPHAQGAWIGVMLFSWYLIYALWAMDSNDFKRPWLKKVFMVPLFCLALCAAFWVFGFRLNPTASLPQGVYRLGASVAEPHRGDLVSFCLPADNPYSDLAQRRGYLSEGSCPNGLKPLLKHVAGLPGDNIHVSLEGIYVNGDFISGSTRPRQDSQGRDLPPSLLMDGLIPEGFVLTLSTDHPGSFDSRHFGLIDINSLKPVSSFYTF